MYLLYCKPMLFLVVHCLKVSFGLESVSFIQDQYSKQHCLWHAVLQASIASYKYSYFSSYAVAQHCQL
jgi:hypothetical protein